MSCVFFQSILKWDGKISIQGWEGGVTVTTHSAAIQYLFSEVPADDGRLSLLNCRCGPCFLGWHVAGAGCKIGVLEILSCLHRKGEMSTAVRSNGNKGSYWSPITSLIRMLWEKSECKLSGGWIRTWDLGDVGLLFIYSPYILRRRRCLRIYDVEC